MARKIKIELPINNILADKALMVIMRKLIKNELLKILQGYLIEKNNLPAIKKAMEISMSKALPT